MRWRLVWFGALSALGGLELWALGAQPEATLSAQVIPLLLADPFVWTGTLAAWVTFSSWLVWHWWFQYRNRR